MPTIRLMSFNAENLLARFRFREFEKVRLATLLDIENEADRADLIRTHWNVLNDEIRTFTALAIRVADPEIICLQEVDSFRTLKLFHDRYVRRFTGRDYRHMMLVDGNDPRGIDVAALSRFKIAAATSHQELTFAELNIPPPPGESPNDRIFRRDCLEVHVKKSNNVLPIFICHFKSMSGGREETRAKRAAEALAVRRIIEATFNDPAAADWVIIGDLNDYTETDGAADVAHGLGNLLDDGFTVDLVKRLADPLDRWTHFYAGEGSYHQLDYILLSPSLAAKNTAVAPTIVRQGQPFRAERYQGGRFPRIGWDRPKASDHCPVYVDLDF